MLKRDATAARRRSRAKKTTIAGSPLDEPRATFTRPPPAAAPSSSGRGSPRRAAARAPAVTSSKKRGSSRVSSVRGCGRSTSTMPAIRPGRGLITTTRVERNTASEIECVTKTTVDACCCQIASSSMFRRSRVISSSAPNGSSISSSAGSKASARAIATRCCMPPESCHGWWSPKPCSSTRSSISSTRCFRSGAVPAEHLERQRDVLRDRAPVEEHGVLEDDAVVVVGARLAAPACRSPRPCPRSARQVADQAQQRRLAAAGRPDQRHELARRDLEVDPLERGDVAPRETSSSRRRAATTGSTALMPCASGARRTTSFSARTTARKKSDAERRRDDVRRPQLLRLDRVVLVEVEDRAAEAALQARRQLADDRADDAGGRCDRRAREQVRERRAARAASRGPASGSPRRSASARARAGRPTGGRAAC